MPRILKTLSALSILPKLSRLLRLAILCDVAASSASKDISVSFLFKNDLCILYITQLLHAKPALGADSIHRLSA